MIEQRTLARPYAKAIFEIAEKNQDYTKWSEQLEVLAWITEDKQVQRLLQEVTIPSQQIAEFYKQVGKKVFDEQANNLIQILALKKRLTLLPEIANLFKALRFEAENTLPVKIFTVLPLDEKKKSAFAAFLEKYFDKTIKLDTVLDESLMGGYKIKAGDIVMDGSLKGSLEQLKEAMVENYGN